jgi:fructose-1,6-bisphosphatase I
MDKILKNLKHSIIEISNKIRYHNSINLGNTLINSRNKSGESPKELDLICNDLIINKLKNIKNVRHIASEENDELIECNSSGDYLITLDPLDGSSCISSNLPIGTIFAIWKYKQKDQTYFQEESEISWTNSSRLPSLLGIKSISGSFEQNHLQNGHDIVLAGYSLYSYSTQIVIADKSKVSLELLNNKYEFETIESNLKLPHNGDTYSYNSSLISNSKVNKLVDIFNKENYNHRYVGSLVGDIHRTLLNGGIFMYPETIKNKNGKLRLLYEGYPMSFIFNKAGGRSSNGITDILDVPFPENIHERTPLILASKKEMELYNTI